MKKGLSYKQKRVCVVGNFPFLFLRKKIKMLKLGKIFNLNKLWLSVKVRQKDRSDCGAAALASVAAHYGFKVSVALIRYFSGTDSSGTTIKGIKEAAQKIGFQAEAYRGTILSLTKIPKPAILHLRKKDGFLHYIVLLSYKKGKFYIMDPAFGEIIKKTAKELIEEWSGVLILFTLNPNMIIGKEQSKLQIAPHLKQLKSILRSKWRVFPITLLISILHIAAMLATALFIKELLDVVIPLGDSARLKMLSLIMILIIATSALLSFVRSKLLLKTSIDTDQKLTNEYLDHLYHIPLPCFNSFKTGELTSRIGDVYRIRNLIASTIPESIVAVVTLLFSVIVLFKLNSKLAVLTALFIPIYVSIFLIHDKVNRPLMKKFMERASLFQSSVIESLRSMATIRNFGIESMALAKSGIRLKELNETFETTGKAALVAGGAADFTSRVLTIAVLWFGGAAVIGGKITLGEMVSFYTITALFSAPLQELAGAFSSFREGFIASSRLYDIISLQREVQEIDSSNNKYEIERKSEGLKKSGEKPIERCKIIANELSFGYPGRSLLFEDLSFTIESGKILLLNGGSGCGKSTVVSLLLKHLEPVSGSLSWSGSNLGSLKKWRENIAIVPQNPDLYGQSILECIMSGEEIEDDLEYFNRLSKELELDKMANRLPYGFATNPGEGGAMLSRGEQQRIAFARAAMKRAPVMLLDEATSSLDKESESLIRDSVERLKKEGCAILIISHDPKFRLIANQTVTIKK